MASPAGIKEAIQFNLKTLGDDPKKDTHYSVNFDEADCERISKMGRFFLHS